MRDIKINKKSGESAAIALKDKLAGELRVYLYRPGNDFFNNPFVCQLHRIEDKEDTVELVWVRDDEELIVKLVLQQNSDSDGFVGTLSAEGKGCAVIKLVWELPADVKGFPFMPAFMYGFNKGGKSPWATYPQLRSDSKVDFGKPWLADEWLVRADRSSHCLTSIISDEFTAAVGGRDVCRFTNGSIAEKNGLGISGTNPHRLTFSLGFFNVPYTYSTILGRNFISRPEGYVNLDEGRVESDFFLFLFKERSRFSAASRLLRNSYNLFDDKVNDAGGIEEAVDAISQAIIDYAYCDEVRNFYCNVFNDSRINHNIYNFPTGWTGGLRTAYPLLLAGYAMNRTDWISCARNVYSNIADNAISPKSGLFYENYNQETDEWNTKGWWYGAMEKPGHSGYINGHICHYLLLGYIYENQRGNEYNNWLKAAKEVLDKVAAEQWSDGRFGYSYDEQTGKILDGEGFAGCWFTPAFASLYAITKDKKYLNVAKKAMNFYRRFVKDFHVWGCPHDIFKSPDEEGILAWIEASKILYQATNDKRFSDDLIMGLEYEFSWKFAYNVVNEVEPLKSLDWCSKGGSVTSVNNSHIHPMGSATVNSILYAAQVTDDEYFWSRLRDTVRWTLTIYLHYDGHYGWGKRGLINERFCYTDSLLLERFPDGSPASTWFAGHSWASGAALEGLVGEIFEFHREKPVLLLQK